MNRIYFKMPVIPMQTWVVVLLLLLGRGFASAAPDPFDFHAANVVLLTAKPIQAELKVTDRQRAAMNKHSKTRDSKINAYSAELEKKSKAQGKEAKPSVERVHQIELDFKRKVIGELSAVQLKRLRELSLQQVGYAALVDPEVHKKLGLSSGQITALRQSFEKNFEGAMKLQEDAAAKVYKQFENRKPKNEAEAKKLQQELERRLEEAGHKIGPQVDRLKADYDATVEKTLSQSQKKTWQALLGKQFQG